MIPNKIVERAIATLEHAIRGDDGTRRSGGIANSYHVLYGPVWDGDTLGLYLPEYEVPWRPWQHIVGRGGNRVEWGFSTRAWFFDGWELAGNAREQADDVARHAGTYLSYEESCTDAITRIADMESYWQTPGEPW